jgi:hypothetical protein
MLKNIFAGLIGFAFLASSLGCQKTCDQCLHSGTCTPGSACSCPDPWSGYRCDTMCYPGFEGYMCLTLSKNKFFGTWNCTSTDPTGNSKSYTITFSDYPAYGPWMYMNNFNNNGTAILCNMAGKYKFNIDPGDTTIGPLRVPVSGYCQESGNKMTMYVTLNGVEYFGSATMQ